MFDWKRLSREDYEIFGNCMVWEADDLAVVMAAFKTEMSGVYGNSEELFPIRRLIFDNSHSDTEETFCDNYSKYFRIILKALGSQSIQYANVISKKDPEPEEENARAVVSKGLCCINTRDFLDYLIDNINSIDPEFDLDKFGQFLDGEGTAPSEKIVISQDKTLSEHMRDVAKERHKKSEPLKHSLVNFLAEDLSGGCTCTKRQACDRIYKEFYNNDEKRLKNDTGFGFLSFTRKVSKAIQQAEIGTGVNRHENTEGFSPDKLPTTCSKHPKK